jgi:fused signal recognition particle receptor
LDLLERLRKGLGATRARFGERLGVGGPAFTADALEEALLAADVGVEAAEEIAEEYRRAGGRDVELAGGQVEWLKERLRQVLTLSSVLPVRGSPHVVLVVGVNGTGKTTTVAKLAAAARARGATAAMVAADTFRAAAVEQLQRWGERLQIPVVARRAGADPAAVVFDGLSTAVARGMQEVYVDTAGRLHTKHNLMAELEKVRRVCARAVDAAPHEVLLVLDATTGSNGLAQAREFRQRAGVTGVVLTKLDGTAKGGVALAVARELGVPVRWVGVGESAEDLLPFEPAAYIDALLGGLR